MNVPVFSLPLRTRCGRGSKNNFLVSIIVLRAAPTQNLAFQFSFLSISQAFTWYLEFELTRLSFDLSSYKINLKLPCAHRWLVKL